MVVSRRLGDAQGAATELDRALRATLRRTGLTVLGPAPAVFARLQDRYRFQILIKGTLRPAERTWLADCLRALRDTRRGVDAAHDVDPVTIY
jgi:primosomal protein N'